MRPVGIERITAYPCALSLDMRALAEARDHDPRHPLEELLVTERSLNPPWEDPVTMAVNAALQIVRPEDREDIELVIVGTESSVDFGKPISTYVQRYCGITANCRNFETKHACYGGTSALMMAAHWVASGAAPGKKALVVCTDQSRSHVGKPWEYVLGAAATAMIVSDTPDVLAIDLPGCGYWTNEIFDTYRPTSTTEVGHADTSLYGYLEALEGAHEHFVARAKVEDYDAEFARHIYHVPFGGMTLRAHRQVMRRWRPDMTQRQAREHFDRKTRPSLRYNARFGGTYTSATFIALLGLLDAGDDLQAGDRVSIFSYGSGSCAEFYPATVGPRARERVAEQRIAARLDARRPVTVGEYEAIERARAAQVDQADVAVDLEFVDGLYERAYAGKGRLVLAGVSGFQREYRLA